MRPQFGGGRGREGDSRFCGGVVAGVLAPSRAPPPGRKSNERPISDEPSKGPGLKNGGKRPVRAHEGWRGCTGVAEPNGSKAGPARDCAYADEDLVLADSTDNIRSKLVPTAAAVAAPPGPAVRPR